MKHYFSFIRKNSSTNVAPPVKQIPTKNYIYWKKDDVNFEKKNIDGENFFFFYTPSFNLAVRVVDSQTLYYAEIFINNISKNKRIKFNPNESRIAVFEKRTDKTPAELKPYTPEQLGGIADISELFPRTNTVFAGEDIIGRIYFPKKKGEYMYIGIKIGDKLYIKGFDL